MKQYKLVDSQFRTGSSNAEDRTSVECSVTDEDEEEAGLATM